MQTDTKVIPMLRSKTLAVLGAATALLATSPSLAEEPAVQQAKQVRDTADGNQPGIRVTNETPDDDSLVNGRNGKTVTLEMVQKDAEWREETAEMLRDDDTSEGTN